MECAPPGWTLDVRCAGDEGRARVTGNLCLQLEVRAMGRRSRPLVLIASAAATMALSAGSASADEKRAQCIDADTKAQDLRRDGKLSEARSELRTCGDPSCPALIRDDCARRLSELEGAQPTIIFDVKDGTGHDVSTVAVRMDGHPFADKLDGRALLVDPGEHEFTFTVAGQAPVTETLVIKESEKERRERVVLGGAAASLTPAQASVASPLSSPPTQGEREPGGRSGPWKTVGWILGGAGAVGLGVGTVFGIVAMGDKSKAHCGSDNLCDPGTSAGVKSAALVSDMGWIAGGVLLAGGVALVLFAPGSSRETTTSAGVRVVPVVTAGGVGIVTAGRW